MAGKTFGFSAAAFAVAALCASMPLRGEVVDGAPDKFVDYITTVGSTATPYIDTGVKGRSGTRLELFFTGWLVGSYSPMIGMRDGQNGHFLIDNPYGNSLRFLYKSGSKSGWAAVSFSTGNYHHVTYQVENDGTCSVFVDGTKQNVSAMNGQGALDSQYSIYLFGYNAEDNPAVASSQTTLYLCRIWQTDGSGAWRLVRNFRPCVKTMNGVERVGLYDAVEGKVYFTFASGSDFAAPPAEEETSILEWVGSTGGMQYVDTEAIGRSGSKVDLKFTGWAEGDYKSLFGFKDGTNHLLMHKPYSNSVQFVYKNAVGWVAVDFGSEKYHELSYAVSDAGTGSVELDGTSTPFTEANAISDQGEFQSVLPFYIFGYNNNGNLAGPGAVARLYGCTISQTDGTGAYVPVRDFKPARKYGLVGMYDTVDGIFIPGVGGLEAGPVTVKPQKYVEYVESSGAQYIDTGIIGRSGTAVQMQFKGWVGGTYTAMVGALGNGGEHMISMSPKGSGITTFYGNAPFAEVAIPFGADTYHDVLTEWATGGACRMFVDGVETDYGNPLGDLTTAQNLYLFAGNNKGTVAWNTAAKLYGCKIWQDGKLVRDFRPCVAPNGKAALYDEVGSQIYYANGGDLAASGTEVAAIAAWKGGSVSSADDFASAGNWTCCKPDGKTEIAGAVPGKATTVVIANVSDPLLSIPAGIAAQGWGGTRLDFDSIALQADADWTPLGSVVLKDGIAIDLAGHNLSAGDVALSGTAAVQNSGTAVAAFSLASAKPVSVAGLTVGDKVKVVKNGVGSLVNTVDGWKISGATGMELEINAGKCYSTAAQYVHIGFGLGDNVGKLTMNGGSFAVSSQLVVGQTTDSVGVLEQTGGYIACAKEMTLGYWSGTGTLRQSGGTLTVNGNIYLGRENGHLGTAGAIEQTGGTIAARAISRPSGASTITFNGGTVRASIANASFFNNLTNVTIGANGLRLETAHDIGFANTTFKTSGGKITKAGAGALDLSGLTVEVGADAPTSFCFAAAVAADGEANVGAFTGLPAVSRPWKVCLTDDGTRCKIYRPGLKVILR